MQKKEQPPTMGLPLKKSLYPGAPTTADTLKKDPTSPSTHCCMLACTMYRKPRPCLSTLWQDNSSSNQ